MCYAINQPASVLFICANICVTPKPSEVENCIQCGMLYIAGYTHVYSKTYEKGEYKIYML